MQKDSFWPANILLAGQEISLFSKTRRFIYTREFTVVGHCTLFCGTQVQSAMDKSTF